MKILRLILLLLVAMVPAQAQLLRTNIMGLHLSTTPSPDNSYVPFSDSRTNNSSYRTSIRAMLNAVGDNWVAEGTTNSTLPGIGRVHDLVATNSIAVGDASSSTNYVEMIGTATNFVEIVNSLDELDNAAGVFIVTNTLTLGDIFEWFNGTNRVAWIDKDGSYHPDGGGSGVIVAGNSISLPNFIDADGYHWNVLDATNVSLTISNVAINPTIGALPYNQDGVAFGDSPLVRTGTNSIATFDNRATNTVSSITDGEVLRQIDTDGQTLALQERVSTNQFIYAWTDANNSTYEVIASATGGTLLLAANGTTIFNISGEAVNGTPVAVVNSLAFHTTGDYATWLNAGSPVFTISADGALLNGTIKWYKGAGDPEGVKTAPVGSFYSRTDGGVGTSFYVKESGAGNTGWQAK